MSTNDIQKITSLNTIYNVNTFGSLPADAELGATYPVQLNGKLCLYEKQEEGYVLKAAVQPTTIYVILDTGLLAVSSADGSVLQVLDTSINQKQNNLVFDEAYDPDSNKVATQKSVANAVAELKEKVDSFDSNL